MNLVIPIYTKKLVYTKGSGVIKIDQKGGYKLGVSPLFIKIFNGFMNDY